MLKRISPTQRLQAEIYEVFAGGEDLASAIERVARLGEQLLLQSALEAEVSAFWGGTATSGPQSPRKPARGCVTGTAR